MSLDTIKQCLENINEEYKATKGNLGELCEWVQDIIEREVVEKYPYRMSKFDYGISRIFYSCPDNSPGYGSFYIYSRQTTMDYTVLVSEVIAEEFGVDVLDKDLKLTALESREWAVHLATCIFQFNVYAAIADSESLP